MIKTSKHHIQETNQQKYSKSKHSTMITEYDEIVYVGTHLNNRVLGLTFEKIK